MRQGTQAFEDASASDDSQRSMLVHCQGPQYLVQTEPTVSRIW